MWVLGCAFLSRISQSNWGVRSVSWFETNQIRSMENGDSVTFKIHTTNIVTHKCASFTRYYFPASIKLAMMFRPQARNFQKWFEMCIPTPTGRNQSLLQISVTKCSSSLLCDSLKTPHFIGKVITPLPVPREGKRTALKCLKTLYFLSL